MDLINSSLILNLNEPSKIADTSWIKPQKYIGVWWGLHLGTHTWTMGPRHGATTENALRHIDFAVANNIQGVLFVTGHEMWMAGASEVIYSTLMMNNGFIAPNLNFEEPDEASAQLNIPTQRVNLEFDTFLSNSFGFGGTNSTLIIRQIKE